MNTIFYDSNRFKSGPLVHEEPAYFKPNPEKAVISLHNVLKFVAIRDREILTYASHRSNDVH